MSYQQKYYKYKTKYLNLKQQQTGGKLFQKKQIFYIVATISQPKLKKITKEVTNTILGENIKPYRAPHITLLNLIINAENTDNIIFQDEKFYNKTKKSYADTIANRNDPLILNAKPYPKDLSFTGYRPRHFIKNYEPENSEKIFEFRERILNSIEGLLGKARIKEYIDNRGAGYYIYSYHGKELFAESKYYDVWKPHLNFLNEFDIEKHNSKLYRELGQSDSMEKVDVLANKIKNIPQEIYDNINMSTQMRNITYSVDHLLQVKFKV